eukprot:1155245-Pelagomonas_calceolata.AAC.1
MRLQTAWLHQVCTSASAGADARHPWPAPPRPHSPRPSRLVPGALGCHTLHQLAQGTLIAVHAVILSTPLLPVFHEKLAKPWASGWVPGAPHSRPADTMELAEPQASGLVPGAPRPCPADTKEGSAASHAAAHQCDCQELSVHQAVLLEGAMRLAQVALCRHLCIASSRMRNDVGSAAATHNDTRAPGQLNSSSFLPQQSSKAGTVALSWRHGMLQLTFG